jgi:hypothetical protein
LEVWREIEAEGHDPVFGETEAVAVEIDLGGLADAFELNEYAASRCDGG